MRDSEFALNRVQKIYNSFLLVKCDMRKGNDNNNKKDISDLEVK